MARMAVMAVMPLMALVCLPACLDPALFVDFAREREIGMKMRVKMLAAQVLSLQATPFLFFYRVGPAVRLHAPASLETA